MQFVFIYLFILFGMLNLMIKEDNYRLTRSKARIEFVPWWVHNALFFSLKKKIIIIFALFFFFASTHPLSKEEIIINNYNMKKGLLSY